MSIEYFTRIIQQRGLKADCESNSGSIEEGAIAFATDTQEIGLYTNGAWFWFGNSSEEGSIFCPQVSFNFIDVFKVAIGSAAITKAVDTGQYFNIIYTYVGANNDALEFPILLDSGIYDIEVLGNTYNSRPILDWKCDGNNFITGQDWYSAAIVRNVIKTGALTIVSSGRHLIRCQINGRHASSSAYNIALTSIKFVRQTFSI